LTCLKIPQIGCPPGPVWRAPAALRVAQNTSDSGRALCDISQAGYSPAAKDVLNRSRSKCGNAMIPDLHDAMRLPIRFSQCHG
jgi:hypothetical protein